MRACAQIVALATLLMAGLDLVPSSGRPIAANTFGIIQSGQLAASARSVGDRGASGALVTTLELVRGELPNVSEILGQYPPRHDRVRASYGLRKLGLLFMPFIAAGFVLGLGVWIDQRVVFRSGRDEVVAMIVIAWALSPLTVLVSDSLAGQAQEAAMSGEGALWMMIAAYAPTLLVGSFGWLAYYRWHDAE